MTRFSSLALSPDGKLYLRQQEVQAFELRVGVKAGIAFSLIALSLYVNITVFSIVLGLVGIVILIATIITTYLMLKRDLDAMNYRLVHSSDSLTSLGASPDPIRTITVKQGDRVSQMMIDPLSDALTKHILKLLDTSITLVGPESTVFPTYRALGMPYSEYDAALRGLGTLVQRRTGSPPRLLPPHTLRTLRGMFENGSIAPYRPSVPPSAHSGK